MKFYLLLFSLLFSLSASAVESVFEKMDLRIKAEIPRSILWMDLRMELQNVEAGPVQAVWTSGRVSRFFDEQTGEDIPFQVLPLQGYSPELGYKIFRFRLNEFKQKLTLRMQFSYDSGTFSGVTMNPLTKDPLLLGQILPNSVFSSHLYYYPFFFDGPQKANILFDLPRGWRAVTTGDFDQETYSQTGDFLFQILKPSPSLPFPISIFPFAQVGRVYQKRLRVSLHAAAQDLSFAEQKLRALTTVILPFLESLMGPYPHKSLRIVEVFPTQGNIREAGQEVVLLSQKLWFQTELDPILSNEASLALVSEISKQWNSYLARMPTFLAEGMSEFTSVLFLERQKGPQAARESLLKLQDVYEKEALLLRQLTELRRQGLSLEAAAAQLKLPLNEVATFWAYAVWGELPLTDPRVFPGFMMSKGSLALHALRTTMPDLIFFRAYRKVFEAARKNPDLSLEDVKNIFEAESRLNLNNFFLAWYAGRGLPVHLPPIANEPEPLATK